MSPVLVLDLDDTLYPEQSYVESGFRAVALDLQQRFGWPADESLRAMLATLAAEGRGAVFDRLLAAHGALSKQLIGQCLKTYRHHRPQLALYPAARRLLDRWTGPCYLVTDGHKIVQASKVAALNLAERLDGVYITHRYGIRHAKPSLHCFELIRRRTGCDWADLTYIGDNPAKDFVNLNAVGAHTVRVLTGRHRDDPARPGHEAGRRIASLDEWPAG